MKLLLREQTYFRIRIVGRSLHDLRFFLYVVQPSVFTLHEYRSQNVQEHISERVKIVLHFCIAAEMWVHSR